MAINLLNLGAVADDRTGDNFRAGGTKINAMMTELYGLIGSDPVTFVSEEADFPVQDATTITLEAGKIYQYTASFTTAKAFIVGNNSKITAFNFFSPTLTYSGTGSMFTGTDASFSINECRISCPNAQVASFTDTAGGLFSFLMNTVSITAAAKLGTFNNLQTVQVNNSSSISMGDGLSFTGSASIIITIDKLFMSSTNASFEGIDFGTAIAQTIEIADLICVGPAGSIGIKGAALSANVPSGVEATVTGCNLSAVTTPLSGITVDDIRWKFTDNSAIPDTLEDGLLSFNNNSTETVITTINTPVLVNGTSIVIRTSHFTGTTAGRLTFNGQRIVTVPIDISVGLISVGGGAINVTVYLAKNGSVITNSATTVSISGSTQRTFSLPWQDSIDTGDYYEVYVENNSGTTNIIVQMQRLRIR
jgi:hypothetical protein